ncbi:D-alanyl-D-alanine carboxypeptidase family protein [Streptococcus moroccensis]|uniref:D-alanyl-D-alanine carboxypeptidase n=1 Tax=Streptococcus moroccensis TaxID=1451356 RepID=A0ABT9YTM8_9STRE|nr:serine hydrolase [Streptococcus moroccensis]MDQ0223343.1 D-alanyl-D-alanine carboxypeptidase [Streptococcus moroccensis]
MKRLKGFFVVSLILISSLVGHFQAVLATEKTSEIDLVKAMGEDLDGSYQPQGGSIVIDAATGQVLYEQDADKVWHVASLTKIMTLYLAYEALEAGEISEQETFKVTQKYVDISQIYALSNNKMVLGAEYTFDDLAKLMMIVSSNAATMLMADTIAEDESAFVDLMNAKAKELGMTQTQFYNASGSSNELLGDYAPKNQPKDGDNQGTARDFALLSYHLLKNYPQAITHTRQYELTIKKETDYEESFTAHHLSLEGGRQPTKEPMV